MEPTIKEDLKDCLICSYRSPMFNCLTHEELRMMRENRIPVVFKKGEIIRKQGTHMSHVISVTHGFAKLYREGAKNINSIVRIVKPTNFIGGPAIFLDQIHHFTVAALMETHVCFINLQIFKDILDQNKKFQEEFLRDYSRNVVSVYSRLIDLTNKQIPGRMADTLLYLFESVFERDTFHMVFSKQDMADISAMSKYSACKILKEFQNDGIISLTNNQLILNKSEVLRRISMNG